MPNPFTDALHIELSPRKVTVKKSARWLRLQREASGEALVLPSNTLQPKQLVGALSSLLQEHGYTDLATSIVLGDELARLFIVTPPHNIERMADCQAAAAMRFQALYDESPATWKIAADWSSQHPFLACAIPDALLAAIDQLSRQHRLKLMTIQPRFIAAANRWRKTLGAKAWLGVLDEGQMTLGVIRQHRLCTVRRLTMPDNGWQQDAWLPAQLEREALRLDLPMPTRLYVCGSVPGDWNSRDFGPLSCIRLGDSQQATAVRVKSVHAAMRGSGGRP